MTNPKGRGTLAHRQSHSSTDLLSGSVALRIASMQIFPCQAVSLCYDKPPTHALGSTSPSRGLAYLQNA